VTQHIVVSVRLDPGLLRAGCQLYFAPVERSQSVRVQELPTLLVRARVLPALVWREQLGCILQSLSFVCLEDAGATPILVSHGHFEQMPESLRRFPDPDPVPRTCCDPRRASQTQRLQKIPRPYDDGGPLKQTMHGDWRRVQLFPVYHPPRELCPDCHLESVRRRSGCRTLLTDHYGHVHVSAYDLHRQHQDRLPCASCLRSSSTAAAWGNEGVLGRVATATPAGERCS